jgi:hypothetical protein
MTRNAPASSPGFRRLSRIALASTCALLAAPALATTWIVDAANGPGANFTDLAPAVAAAVPGDVILVRAGTYNAFTLSEGLAILGETGARVRSGTVISNLPAAQLAVVSRLDLTDLRILGCAGAVLVDHLFVEDVPIPSFLAPSAALCLVNGSSDVRFYRCTVRPKQQTANAYGGRAGISAVSSRVELARCAIYGGDGWDDTDCGGPTWGGVGVACDSARVHIALSSVQGGEGGDGAQTCSEGASGGDAVGAGGDASVIIAGQPADLIKGGAIGQLGNAGTPSYPGAGVSVYAPASLRWSGATIQAGAPWWNDIEVTPGAVVVQAVPDDPTLELQGSATAGATLSVRLHGVSSTEARLRRGNTALVLPDGLATIEQLTNEVRVHPLGTIPASGTALLSMILPRGWRPGRVWFLQGHQYDASTGLLIERTNSVPLIMR